MSQIQGEALPISLKLCPIRTLLIRKSRSRFAQAIRDLPLANLYFKAAEIRNSIAHLKSSNQQLNQLAEEGDSDCVEAIQENVGVIQRMEERIQLLKQEVESRGFKWGNDAQESGDVDMKAHHDEGDQVTLRTDNEHLTRSSGGVLGDEELAQRYRLLQEDEDVVGGGVHL